ncbi:hypothetical protein Back11_63650 [Paenibacillus baekrokdamisoli]|uniref:DNA-binding response regulator n=2 Tax=Paenibacillus baekrokdamisoli TaxID=1712516 RepID=A0A3G9J1G1_9BACL|nr:response regulator [Paenibacillus baekrokdamisoli]BBH25020.1 hypothetical protein Back11_63650 [Paenibacillus baekrokdamisoli]
MLKLLIVDDEVHFVKAVKKMVDWSKLGVSNVYIAYNVSTAEKIFQTHDIHVLLCDIEMPQGSGLELLEWLQRSELRTVPILMTCHADFQYAKEAVRLGCSHYLLKPLSKEELENAILKAADTAIRERELADALLYRQWWSRQQAIHHERFWTDLLNETIPARSEAVIREAAARQISHFPEAAVLPVLLVVRGWHQEFPTKDRKLLEYALKNAGEELIGGMRTGSVIVPVGKESWLLIMPVSQEKKEGVGESSLGMMCGQFVEFCKKHLYCEVACYEAEPIQAHEISSLLVRLLELDRNNVNGQNYVSLADYSQSAIVQLAMPDMSGWAAMLRQGIKERLLEETILFIRGLRLQSGIDSRYLLAFKADFLQMAHAVLQQQGVQAHLMFCDASSLRLAEKAIRSLADLERWLTHVVIQAANYTHVSLVRNVIDRATRYMLSNLDQHLSRESVANHVYLNPDYLTRLFKRELGCTIPEYMLRERMKLAKQLLAHSDLAVSAVSMAVGYSNFSHFAKLFKQHTSLTPIEFRQSGRKGDIDKVEIASGKSRS